MGAKDSTAGQLPMMEKRDCMGGLTLVENYTHIARPRAPFSCCPETSDMCGLVMLTVSPCHIFTGDPSDKRLAFGESRWRRFGDPTADLAACQCLPPLRAVNPSLKRPGLARKGLNISCKIPEVAVIIIIQLILIMHPTVIISNGDPCDLLPCCRRIYRIPVL